MRPGDVVADRFEIEELAGSGAMGSVFRTRDRLTGERVALKTLRDEGKAFADRFVREGRIMASLTHPAVVRYVAHGGTAAGELWLVMEWLDGEDLSRRLGRMGLTLAESAALGARVAGALAAAHAQGIVHRDVKPSNVFLPGGDVAQAKILDFGIARLTQGTQMHGTKTGIMVGTPGYMSPEQARGQKGIDERADVFSLGCVLYQCLTGRPPFVADDLFAVLAKLVFEEVPRVVEVRPDVPAALDDLVAAMMSKSADARPKDCAAIARTLSDLAAELPAAGDRPAGAPALPPAITEAEQRLMSVVIAAGDESRGQDAGRASAEEARLAEAVRPFGADVVELADGALMVTLAADAEPTDQAAKAARCGLAMRAALPGREIVLATGRSVLGGRLPFGEVIDRAAAMLRSSAAARSETASPARTRVDEVTAGLLDSRFEIGGDALSLFLVAEREELEGAARTLLGKITPCVGRDRELAILEATAAECASESVARAVIVSAPVGIGKSRLRQEFLRRLADRGPEAGPPIEVWIARGDPMGQGSPFRMVAQAVRRATGLLDGETLNVRRWKIKARVARRLSGEDATRVSEFLGEVCGVPFPDENSVQLRAARQDPVRMGDQMYRAFEDFLAAECGARPVLVVLEDLHWGDLPSVQWFDAALRNLHDRRLMVLALARPEVFDTFPQLWAGRSVQTIVLGELGKKACEKLVRLVLGERIKAEVVSEIVDRAGGNPFYLEEMIRAVAEGRGDRLPPTVLAMVQARLDRLDADARRILRAASIFGQVFWAGGVAALLGAEAIRPAEQLADLVKREVIVPRPAEKIPGDSEYAFRNAPVRDASYASFTDEDRVLGHRLAGEWLEKAGETDAFVLAEHFHEGGDPGRAVGFYLDAALTALEGNDFTAALDRAERGIACGAQGGIQGAFVVIQAEAHKWLGNNVEAEAAGVRALALLERGSVRWLRALADLATVRAKMGQHEGVLALARDLLAAEPTPIPSSFATAAARVAIQLLHTGHLEVADAVLARAEAAAANAEPEPAMTASIYQARAIRAMFWGDVGAFLSFMTAAAEQFELAGDLRSAGTQRANQAYAYIELGAYAAAEQWLRHVLATAERMGLRDLAAGARHNLGIALARTGALEEARAEETAAVRASVAQRNRRLESGCRTYLAIILLLSGNLVGAEREARAAVEILSVAPPMRAHALATLSEALLLQGRAVEALAAAEEAMKLIHAVSGVEEGELAVRLAYVEALIKNGKDARGALAIAADRLRQRAAPISDPAWRTSLLTNVPENARILELERLWLGAR
jgi:tetratricopeptide (TPR) repeat protein